VPADPVAADSVPADPVPADGGPADAGPADSAGVPWGGRTLPRGDFAGDDGTADPALRRTLDDRAADAADDAAVVRALASARVLVPVVAVRVEEAGTVHGPSDKQADMALVTLTGPDGRRALPVFSSVETLARWDRSARPVAVESRRAVASAVAESCDLVVVDPAGPVTFVVTRPALWAIGQGREWCPAHEDPDVLAELRRAVAAEPDVAGVEGEAGSGAQLRVVLRVRPGLDGDEVRALAGRVGQALRASALVAERVEGLELQVLPA
jgi:SseB protein N-terminal domain